MKIIHYFSKLFTSLLSHDCSAQSDIADLGQGGGKLQSMQHLELDVRGFSALRDIADLQQLQLGLEPIILNHEALT